MKNRGSQVPPRESRRAKTFALAAAVVLAAAAAARQGFIYSWKTRGGEFLFMRYHFSEESADHPRLQFLRKREKLDEVVAPGKTQFDKIVLLRKWAHDQWVNHGAFYYPPWDAVEILDLARKYQNNGFCGQYSIVFAQAAQSLGLHVRYVNLGHFLTEVWSDDYDRWVVMDPTNDWHYERNGIPMNGRELADAAWHDKGEGIDKIGSDGSRTPLAADGLKAWRGYTIVTRSDHLSKPIVVKRDGRLEPLTHQDDYHRYLRLGRDDVSWVGEIMAWVPPDMPAALDPATPATADAADFRDVYNQTFIFVVAKNSRRGFVKLKLLAEHAPEFQSFVIDGNHETDQEGEVFLSLKPGVNEFSARVKTRFGWLGPESRIKLYYKPDWLSRRGPPTAEELKRGLL
ncbi:MAG: transglutaminase-like domain-containing protein [Elusimicrobiota bacterium]